MPSTTRDDDPRTDPVGTVRRGPNNTWVKVLDPPDDTDCWVMLGTPYDEPLWMAPNRKVRGVPRVPVSPPVPATQDEVREQLAAAIKAEDVLRGFDTRGEWYARFADAALTVVAPVLEGLYREIDRLRDKLDEERQANSHETGHLEADRECMVQEIQRLRRERDAARLWNKAHETNNAALGKTNRELAAERDALSSLLRGMARRVGDFRRELTELAAELPCGWCKGTGIAPEETFGRDGDGAPMVDGDQPCPEGCRPSVSDQTPATPDPAGFSVLVCDEPELHKQSGQHDDECWIDAGLLDPAPSSVQGDTTPGVPIIEVDADSELGRRMEADSAQSGVDTPDCDCGHSGMGKGWHASNCDWLRIWSDEPASSAPSDTTEEA